MNDKPSPAYLLVGSIISLAVAATAAVLTFVFAAPGETRFAFLLLSASFLSFGIGEVLNHPAHSGNFSTRGREKEGTPFFQRARNPCGLGNLLVILSLLLFFSSLGKLIRF